MEITNKRKTQAQRSHEMRTRLIIATLDCLELHGFHGTTLSRILDRAKVSRGAWRHHFKSKNDLVVAAAGHFYTKALEKSDSLFNLAETGNLDEWFDFLWNHFHQGKHRNIWAEFTLACRCDDDLNNELTHVVNHFFSSMEKNIVECIAATNRNHEKMQVIIRLIIFASRGMAFQSIVNDDPDYYHKIRREFADLLSELL